MNQIKIKIRKGEIADAERIARFNQNMAMETENIELIPEVILAGVKTMLSNPNLGFYLVAQNNDDIVASLMVTTEWSDWRNGQFWWIQSVYVESDWRRQGLYTRLYDSVKEMAEADSGVCGYRLYVEKENTRAQATYDKAGMKETHYKMYEELVESVEFKR